MMKLWWSKTSRIHYLGLSYCICPYLELKQLRMNDTTSAVHKIHWQHEIPDLMKKIFAGSLLINYYTWYKELSFKARGNEVISFSTEHYTDINRGRFFPIKLKGECSCTDQYISAMFVSSLTIEMKRSTLRMNNSEVFTASFDDKNSWSRVDRISIFFSFSIHKRIH